MGRREEGSEGRIRMADIHPLDDPLGAGSDVGDTIDRHQAVCALAGDAQEAARAVVLE